MSQSSKRKSVDVSSDFEPWPSSDSPEESWGSSDSDGEWPVDSILREEVTYKGEKRYLVKWAKWRRADGTDTTWERTLTGNNNLLPNWHREERRRKENLAEKSTDMTIARISCQLHEIGTAENNEAYEQKLKRYNRQPQQLLHWDAEIEEKRSAVLDDTAEVLSSSLRSRRRGSQSTTRRSPSISSEEYIPQVHQRQIDVTSSPFETYEMQRSDHEMPARNSNIQPHTRTSMEQRWNNVARIAKAARITIVNDIDDEEYPSVDPSFEYRESRCSYGKGVKRPGEIREFIVGCTCGKTCQTPQECACLDSSTLMSDDGEKSFAYDKKGLFLFNNERSEVIECNMECQCNERCPNRVAQKPRDVPIEVFKTTRNGWGARATVDLPKGKVIGLYTGTILTRNEADGIPVEDKNYIFDLDVRDDDESVHDHFSIDATNAGNWTRFVNHSCDPVASVYSVVFDRTIECNMPHLAFVTNRALPARTEITIDYSPQFAMEPTKKAKGKAKVKAGDRPCRCGTANCRGWL
ncbi:SET domain-containing protein [Rickenella mellea]|uniref:SET domain-containing protein n=1 Tax=Rickenella mellea TaxID=50990 RepID=A0A4Y7QLL3_9AGAM|nr:SET domain-containing protein [Rickenella mellea]